MSLNFEIKTKTRLVIQRLSASVVAITLSLQQSVVYQGIFKFLAESVDKFISEIRSITEQINATYSNVKDYVSHLNQLASKGGAFTKKLIAYLDEIFENPDDNMLKEVKFNLQAAFQSEAITCAAIRGRNLILGGKNGIVRTIDPIAGRTLAETKALSNHVSAIGVTYDNLLLIGTDRGVFQINESGKQIDTFNATFVDRVTAVAYVQKFIATGSNDGWLRLFTERGLQVVSDKIGRSIGSIVRNKEELLIASDTSVFIFDGEKIRREIKGQFTIKTMLLFDDDTLIVAGEGGLAHINLTNGIFLRSYAESTTADYVGLAPLSQNLFCAATAEGKVIAINFKAMAEVGHIDLGFELRGLTSVQGKVFAFGGNWKNKGRSLALLQWEEFDPRAV